MIKEFWNNNDKMDGFFIGALFAVIVIAFSRSAAEDPQKALNGNKLDCVTTCADRKAYERWPMANQPQVQFSEDLKKRYGEKVVK